MSIQPPAIFGGLLILSSFVISPAVVTVPGTDWMELVLIWLTISMPTGSRKTTVYQILRGSLQDIRCMAGCSGIIRSTAAMHAKHHIQLLTRTCCYNYLMINLQMPTPIGFCKMQLLKGFLWQKMEDNNWECLVSFLHF